MFAPYGDESVSQASDIERLRRSTIIFPPRRKILHEGRGSCDVYQIYKGWAICYKITEDYRRQIVCILLPGDMIGLPLLFNEHMTVSVKSLTSVTACVFDRQSMVQHLTSRPSVALRCVSFVGSMLMSADDQLLSLGRRFAVERIARLVGALVGRLQERGMCDGNVYPFPLTQTHLADATGLSPIHVGRVLRELRDAGVIEVNRRKLTVHDSARLLQMT